MKRFKMSYSNGMLSETARFAGGKDGKDGLPGVGFKLTPAGNFDLQRKRLTNLAEGTGNDDAITKHQVDTLATQLRADSLQVDGSSHMTGDLDLRGQKLINPGEIEMNRKLIKNLDTDENEDLSAVNMITLKKFHPNAPAPTHEVTKDIDLKQRFNVLNSKQRNLSELKTHYDSLVSFEEVKENFLSRQEEFPMETQLDMNHNSITNLKDPAFGGEAATKAYVDATSSTIVSSTAGSIATRLPLSGGTMTGPLDMGTKSISNLPTPTTPSEATSKQYVDWQLNIKIGSVVADMIKSEEELRKYVDDSHNTTGRPKDSFRYVMEDVDESSNESGLRGTAIVDFPNSGHLFNKKAYAFKVAKDDTNLFAGRLGLNMFKLPEGEFTLCIEFFPAKMTGVSVNVVSTSLNVGKQTTKKFSNLARSIVHLHKWRISPPEYIYVDLKWQGVESDPAEGDAKPIVYGMTGSHDDVPSDVFDAPFAFEEGKMVMETDLDLNGHALLKFPLRPSKHFIFARYEKGKHGDCLIFPNEDEDELNYWQQFGSDFRILNVTVFIIQRGPNPVSGSTIIMTSVVNGDRITRKAVNHSTNSVGSLQFTFNQNVGKEEAFFLVLADGNAIQRVKATILIEK